MNEIKRDITTPEEGYIALAREIIECAAKDFKAGILSGDKSKKDMNEKFFHSPVFVKLSLGVVDPEVAVEILTKEAERCRTSGST